MGTVDLICTLPSSWRAELPVAGANNNMTASFSVPHVDSFFLALVYCRREPARVIGTITLTNPPGDNHLSLEFIGLQPLLAVFIFLYLLLLFAWSILCWKRRRVVRPIQTAFAFAIFTKLLEMSLLLAHTWAVNQTGLDHHSLRVAKDIGGSLSSAVLLLVLLLTALYVFLFDFVQLVRVRNPFFCFVSFWLSVNKTNNAKHANTPIYICIPGYANALRFFVFF